MRVVWIFPNCIDHCNILDLSVLPYTFLSGEKWVICLVNLGTRNGHAASRTFSSSFFMGSTCPKEECILFCFSMLQNLWSYLPLSVSGGGLWLFQNFLWLGEEDFLILRFCLLTKITECLDSNLPTYFVSSMYSTHIFLLLTSFGLSYDSIF